MNKTIISALIVWLTLTANLVVAQMPAETDSVYTILAGDSLYAIVKLHFPEHRGNWLEVADQLVRLNPEAFPQGLDTPLRPGTKLRLSATPEERADATAESAVNTGSANPPPNERSTGIRTAGTDESPTGILAAGAAETPAVINARPGSSVQTNPVAASPVPARRVPANPAPASPALAVNKNSVTNAAPVDNLRTSKIGRFTDIAGRVVALDRHDVQRILTTGDDLTTGDTVQTESASTATLHMVDDTMYVLKPNSRLAFENFVYSAQTKKGRSIITLINGGFRANGGLLAENDPANVTYNTPHATVGIRGSHFGLHICFDNNCRSADGKTRLGDGLYAGSLDGAIALINNSGELLAGKGAFYRVENPGDKPVPAPEAALLLFSTDELAVFGETVATPEPMSFWAWLIKFLFGS